jgi:glycerol-3-phosphate dehydrogenase (NAD(P)+)
MSEIAVIGGGAWGTGLAIVLGRKGVHRVRMWVYEKEVCESINQRHENELFLPGRRIPEAVGATNSLQEALRGAEIAVSVMPSHHVRRVFREMQPHLGPEMLFVCA